ncbi:hypothetical protein [Candidatus Odyssella thessalonicensis]|uniref:hypothetical protein n=1 Tax=Candidatus Odyssella thessalonicensis TaxID=84647 RepID=UPI000225AED1|nr:hypothetical protein [Candidatus Odyssella thessalonicensis]
MILSRLICILALINTCSATDSFFSWGKSETEITNPREYAQNCLKTEIYPVLDSSEAFAQCPIRRQFIRLGELKTDMSFKSSPASISLNMSDGSKQLECSVVKFKMSHYHTVIDYMTKYPKGFFGGYIVSYFLPTMISTPVLTAGLLGGAGYVYWHNQAKIMATERNWESIINLLGLTTPLEKALADSKTAIEPAFLVDGNLYYEGYIPNGILPGQSLYIELEAKPEKEYKSPN